MFEKNKDMNKNIKSKEKPSLNRHNKRLSTILHQHKLTTVLCLTRILSQKSRTNNLTYLGLFGNIIVGTSFVLALYFHSSFLLISILGFVANWLSGSLDEKLASYRYKPGWYFLILNVTISWLGIVLAVLGFMIYVGSPFFLFGLLLLILYGLKILISLMKYQITDKHSIHYKIMDSAQMNLFVILLITAELLIPWSIIYSAIFLNAFLIVTIVISLKKLFLLAKERDTYEGVKKNYESALITINDFFILN